MAEKALFLLLLLYTGISLRYLLSFLVRAFKKSRFDEEVTKIFLWFWDGSPEDELYAWYKVRMVLRQREGCDKRMKFVNRKIIRLNKRSMIGNVSVDESGDLVHKQKDLAMES